MIWQMKNENISTKFVFKLKPRSFRLRLQTDSSFKKQEKNQHNLVLFLKNQIAGYFQF